MDNQGGVFVGMEQIAKIEVAGVVAEFKGKYWGVQYDDGRCTCKDFGPIKNAEISDPKYCRKPTDMTYQSRDNPELNKLKLAKLVKVKKTIIFELEK